MVLTDILIPACVKVPLAATDKRSAIAELVELLAACGAVTDAQAMLAAALEREATRTTGIGNGLAIPHAKSPAAGRLVMAVGKPEKPIDFQSVDGKPVSIIVFLASPADKAGPHIQALARISRLMTIESFRTALEKARSSQELFDAVARQEAAAPPTGV